MDEIKVAKENRLEAERVATLEKDHNSLLLAKRDQAKEKLD